MLKCLSGALLAVGILLTASGCGTAADRDAGPTLEVPDEPRASIRSEYRGWRSDDHALYEMEERLIAACMSEQGFVYTPQLTDLGGAEVFDPLPPGDFEISVEDAQQSGYPADSSDSGSDGDVEPSDLQTLSTTQRAAWQAAYLGPEEKRKTTDTTGPGGTQITTELGGCRLTAVEQLYGSFDAYAQADFTDGNLAAFALNSAADDDAMRALDRQWSSCMADGGFSHDAAGEPLERPESARSLAVDRRGEAPAIAVSDAVCQRQLSYADQRISIEDRYLTAVADAYEAEITGALDIKRSALSTGRGLVG